MALRRRLRRFRPDWLLAYVEIGKCRLTSRNGTLSFTALTKEVP